MASKKKTPPVETAAIAPTDAFALFARYVEKGAAADYVEFEQRLKAAGPYKRASNVWDFIDDAVKGTGGFANGEYLFPFKAEIENNKLSDKFSRRKAEADYDRFAEHVCNAPWDLIVSGSDMIERSATGRAEELLGDFWSNVDNRGTAILDFLEYPFRQARQYTVGLIFIDRPDATIESKADDRDPKNRPYAYSVPTRNVVDWEFDEDGKLIAIVILEPGPNHRAGNPCPIRVWTPSSWAVWRPIAQKIKTVADYVLSAWGPNNLGTIPCVPIWNDLPDPGKLFGHSEMLDVSRVAQTVYNIDSEAREIERKCALFLAIPVKSTADAGNKFVIGTDSALVYDGEAGEPRWVSPDLTILDKLTERRRQKIESAYKMAHINALNSDSSAVQTNSGFHAEVEFQKTERRIVRHAAMLEWVEKQLAILFLKFYGIDATADEEAFVIKYPRDFGVRDMQKLIAAVKELLGMSLGEESDRAEVTRLMLARNPRRSEEEIEKMVESAIKARSAASAQKSQLERVKALAATARADSGDKAIA